FSHATLGDRARDQHRMRHVRDRILGRVLGGARDLETAVDAIDRRAKRFFLLACRHADTSESARTSVRLASSTLNALCLYGRAPATAALAAAWNVVSFAGWPTSM